MVFYEAKRTIVSLIKRQYGRYKCLVAISSGWYKRCLTVSYFSIHKNLASINVQSKVYLRVLIND